MPIQSRRRSEVSAARGQNAKGHFSKIALEKKFNNSPVRGDENQGAEIFFFVQKADLSTIPEKMGVVWRSPDFWDFFKIGAKTRPLYSILKQVSIFLKQVSISWLVFFQNFYIVIITEMLTCLWNFI